MTSVASQLPLLSRYEGIHFVSAWQALLKGVLEADTSVSLIAGPLSAFGVVHAEVLSTASVVEPLRENGTRLQSVSAAKRGLALSLRSVRSGRSAVTLVPNSQLAAITSDLASLSALQLDRASLLLVLEDSPHAAPAISPRDLVRNLGIATIEPCDVRQLRDSVDHALRLSRAGRSAAAIVVHESIFRSFDTIEIRPNRVTGSVDSMLARRKLARGLRTGDTSTPPVPSGVLRMARRLEINCFRAMPNPGERVSVGFITVGPADTAMQHITNALGLHGRVPVLQLGLIEPIDEVAVMRMLSRCQQVIVLEPRFGSIEQAVMAVAERMRRKPDIEGQPATVWGREIPADPQSLSGQFEQSDHNIHPSILVRRIAHLLHAIRPTAHVSSQLTPDPVRAAPDIEVPPRDTSIGQSAAITQMRRLLSDVDQQLREEGQAPGEDAIRIVLSLEGAPAQASGEEHLMSAEVWTHRDFVDHGLSAMVQTIRELRRAETQSGAMFIVCEAAEEEVGDLERLARGSIPADVADRVTIATSNFNDAPMLRARIHDLIVEAAQASRMVVLVVKDGPPARFDPATFESALSEIDRLGFEPRQRLVRPADEICAIRPRVHDEQPTAVGEEIGNELIANWTITDVKRSSGMPFRANVRPMIEEVEVIRVRPPLLSGAANARSRLPLPNPIHANASQWRAHFAGFRRRSPGLAALVLCEAGRSMGYHVKCIYDDAPIAPGIRAWAQILFTRPHASNQRQWMTTAIPYGEADLLLGLDYAETMRAIYTDTTLRVASPDRTHIIANSVPFLSESQDAPTDARTALCRSDAQLVLDFLRLCREWFHTDRVADMAMLGAAYQLGVIPVSLESIEVGIAVVQAQGHGRCRDAFEFGRRVALDPAFFRQPPQEDEEDLQRLIRRLILSLSRGAWGGGTRARDFASLLNESLHAMPGLAETQAGRLARQDFVLACHRCRIWGGFSFARQFAELIVRLYRSDRGDNGRMLTRAAVLPLAETILIRDPLYIAGMATSSEQRRALRQHLNVKMARGDRIERRYVTRLEAIAFHRRFRADIRTSDWPARVISLLRRIVPNRIRGTRRQRVLREYVMDVVRRAASSDTDYDTSLQTLQHLHDYALDDRLRGMAVAELKMLVEARTSSTTSLDVASVPLVQTTEQP